ncbi:MAG: hypothetical protein KVP17_004053 [Porospora cf. gigantea B]|uniref:uncharacterized protein n=1 Tax=Porospora cf. gigantea B TaxID=2853592 RepID=UPI0035718AB1|nr:MAG: hypothetical protein KVP17_004053 [Porospora cf. gigantea B]
MGYIGLKDQGLVGISCKDFEGINICGKATQKIGMTDVACVGNEPTMKACTKTISEDIFWWALAAAETQHSLGRCVDRM